MIKQIFSSDFLWGASTAAHQVEGGTHNQWSEWELASADKLAATATKRLDWLPSWERIKNEATNPANYISGNGVEHYERYKEDFKLLKQLNMNAFRFSIEWSRIEPEEGKWDESAVEHYRQYIAELKRMNIEPILTLWHWTMPIWFTDMGGFENRQNVRYFDRYVAKIAHEFGHELQYVLTLNEPNVYTQSSYMAGQWPPQRKNPLLGIMVYRNLVLAHKKAYRSLKAANPELLVGLPMQLGNVQPVHARNPLNRMVVKLAAYIYNWWFLDRVRTEQDFVGVNYYFTQYIDMFGRSRNPKEPLNDLGWYMEPAGKVQVFKAAWKRYGLPIMITEDGLADAQDKWRQWWLDQTLLTLRQSLDSGINIIGYLHWSLLDNFEWAFGWWPKFGLIAVDRTTMQRTIRPSAKWFAEWLEQNG